ncbi:hypothetical protein Fcan01_13936 [Folsomia candida]|uniref:Uncharacterized protein n=1 Tax=Folsomia candida TaxID=158441 RepID=A0A226E1T8_FOLCA|nr:hypothetical protein Fcan01_13936 [Folsomia candida]
MRYHHPVFQPLHFDYGTTTWSVNHMPLFGSILSVLDHRRLNVIHNITFFALMKVLTNGRITAKQSQAVFNLLDLSKNSNFCWVTFNETGKDHITTREFRRTGLFFDFNYPTMYEMFRDYNWDDEKEMEFERFRFYLMSCIHFRQVHRFQAKYIRYRQFKRAVLLLLKKMLRKVLLENVYPSPMSILRAIKTIKIPPLEGTERTKHWTDLFEFNFIRRFVKLGWERLKYLWDSKTKDYPRLKCFCKCICCGLCCCRIDDSEEPGCCGDCDHYCAKKCCFLCKFCKRRKVYKLAKKSKKTNQRWGGNLNEIKGEDAIGLKPAPKKVVDQKELPLLDKSTDNLAETPSVNPQNMKEIRNQRRIKVKMLLTREDIVPAVEWRPLGKPRCGIL